MTASAAGRPQAVPVNLDGIPARLKQADRWLVWCYVPDVDRETGETSWDKPPRCARNGGLASSTNPRTWATFADAVAAFERGGLDGLGFVLCPAAGGDERLVGVDLDKCRDPETGAVETWAAQVVATLDSYTEVSPSGRGLRIFLLGRLPPKGRKRGPYENYETGRYVTVTGQHIPGTPETIEHRQAQLEAVHKTIFGDLDRDETVSRTAHVPADLDDAEIIRRACEAKNGDRFKRLWEGDRGGFGSPSEADLALCNYLAFWCGPDEGRIAGLFAQSGLFRSKWQREDYRARTIGKALQGRTEFYSPGGNGHANGKAGGGAGSARTAAAGDKPHNSDLGNARRVVERHGKDLRYVHPWKCWYVWDGRRWAEDTTAEAVRRVKETQGGLYRWAAAKIQQLGDVGDDAERARQLAALNAMLKHALKWEDARRIAACLELAKSEPGIPALPLQLDADPFAFNALNGTVDLRTGELRPHRREDLISKLAPVQYDPAAGCPLWLKFLGRIMDGNKDLITYLQRVAGYGLTADVSEQCLWFFHGAGANGKSTFLTTLLVMLGDYGMQAVSDLLMVKNHEAHPTERADLFGRRFCATIETEQGKRLAEALMKQMTGGDKVRARRMRQDFFEFSPTHKIALAANHKPAIRGIDLAVWRRIKLVPFTVTISEDEKDRHLPEKLKAELPGILGWAVRGCLDWRREGLAEPDEVRQATAAYQSEQDTVGKFLAECCIRQSEARVKVAALYDAYGRWSGDKFTTQPDFNERLRGRGFESKRETRGYFWRGIALADSAGNEPE